MKVRFAVLLAMLLVAANFACAADDSPLLATEPTISKTEIVFAYGGYLWSVLRTGGEARQLTAGGHESSPYFSPDGKCSRSPPKCGAHLKGRTHRTARASLTCPT